MYRRLAESIPNDIIDKIYEYGKENHKKPKQLYKLIKKKYFLQFPTPCIISGHTIGGLSQRTIERDPDYPDKNHIDWWIYQDCIEDIIADFIIIDDINK